MDLEASTRHEVLSRVLFDENAEPTDLPLSFLKDITNHFSREHEIGSGGFAVVYKGIVGKGMVAVKKLLRTIDVEHEKQFHKEVECLTKAKHKNIVRFLGYCAEVHGKVAMYKGKFVMADVRNWLLCFEYVPNGSLEKYITDASGGLGWSERFRIIKGICEGLHYLHKNHIIHSDLKPANILLDGHMVPKIADFGLSSCLDNEQTSPTTKHLRGTPGYLAPEFYSGKVTFWSDIYSLGVMIMEIVTGEKGYPEYERVIESWMNRLEGDTELEQVRVCTNIAMECTDSNPKKRPVVQCIISMLDKTTSANETVMGSSLVGLQVGLLKEQSDRERIRKLAESFRQEDMKECPETEDVAERLGNYHFQQGNEKTDNWSLRKVQDRERKVNHIGESNFNSNSSVLDKFKFLNILRRDTHRNFESFRGQILRCVKHLRILAEEEINEITINNSELLGRGNFAKVYKGTLPDYTMVAVKTLMVRLVNGDRNAEFLNAMEIQTGMIHKNILKLFGCCLEGDVPILVHEFAANGNLLDILHGNKKQMIPLDLRLDIAIGSAKGLRYMCSRGIRHGYIKPSNILLDEKFTPKISGFELSQLRIMDEAVAIAIFGCMGYIDPVFKNTGLLSQKSDVYSFGAVLLELVTRKKNIFTVNDNHCSLIREYHKCYDIEKTGRAMFDKEIATEEDIFVLKEIGKLALECLNQDIEERPDILEVTDRLVMLGRDRRLGKAHNTKEKTAGPRQTEGI